MSKDTVVVIDSGPLGYLCNPKNREVAKEWLNFLAELDLVIRVPAIIDYECRRKFTLEKFTSSIAILSKFCQRKQYASLMTPEDLDLASELWAYCRSIGRTTTDNKKIDVDVILVAQAIALFDRFDEVIIVTSDPRDLEVFQDAYGVRVWDWRDAIDDISRGSITFYESQNS